jgi:hypothetical protein
MKSQLKIRPICVIALSMLLSWQAKSQSIRAAIQTFNRNYLTALYGGGIGGPASGPGLVALHTDATRAQSWEKFIVHWVNVDHSGFGLQTLSGYYITAVNGGGIAGLPDVILPIRSNAVKIGPNEIFTFNFFYENGQTMVTIQTANGNYLTAVNMGGVGGGFNDPVHSDSRRLDAWETFSLVRQ